MQGQVLSGGKDHYMSYKWIGSVLVIVGCGGVGFSMAASYRREEKYLWQLQEILQFMESELQFRLTPLPELCRLAGNEAYGLLRDIMLILAKELESQVSPDVFSCMAIALKRKDEIPNGLRRLLLQLGHILGRFDLPGQLQGLQSVRNSCSRELKKFEKNRDIRLKSYQTLGLCAGAALAILFV